MLPTRQPQTKMEMLVALPMGLAWMLMFPGATFLMSRLPNSPAEMQPWHWLIAAAVPLLVLASYLTAPVMTRRRLRPTGARNYALELQSGDGTKGSTGLRLLLKALHGRTLGMLAFMALAGLLMYFWISARGRTQFIEQMVMQTFVMLMVFYAMVPDWFSLRMLRTVPLSTRRLTLVLLTMPLVQGIIAAPLMVFAAGLHSGRYPLWFDCIALGFFAAGTGAAMLAWMCHITSAWRFAAIIFPAMLMPFEILKQPRLYPWFIIIGALLLLGSGLLLQRGFWRSAAYYRPRRAWGANMDGSLARS